MKPIKFSLIFTLSFLSFNLFASDTYQKAITQLIQDKDVCVKFHAVFPYNLSAIDYGNQRYMDALLGASLIKESFHKGDVTIKGTFGDEDHKDINYITYDLTEYGERFYKPSNSTSRFCISDFTEIGVPELISETPTKVYAKSTYRLMGDLPNWVIYFQLDRKIRLLSESDRYEHYYNLEKVDGQWLETY